MSTAREKFQRGQRVRFTSDAEFRCPLSYRQTKTGRIVGFSRKPELVRVLRDGVKTAESWHMKFWDVERAQPRQDVPVSDGEQMKDGHDL